MNEINAQAAIDAAAEITRLKQVVEERDRELADLRAEAADLQQARDCSTVIGAHLQLQEMLHLEMQRQGYADCTCVPNRSAALTATYRFREAPTIGSRLRDLIGIGI